MNFENNFNSTLDQIGSFSRSNAASLYDTNSRDSGFEEAPLESLGDDAFLEEFVEINFSETFHLPTDFSSLIQKPIVTLTVSEKPTFRRAFSLEETVSPLKKKVCQGIENGHQEFLIRKKKLVRKSRTEECSNAVVPIANNHLKVYNSEDVIKSAIQRSFSEPNLTADYSRNCSLPLASSRHQDLKAINTNTLKSLLNGEFKERIGSFKIIDCRYPYEFNGGHIDGAINIYTHDQCSSLLEDMTFTRLTDKPNILIFHCEFSAERGPNLYRYLRQEDRKKNVHTYPALYFPEIYILEGGYRKFFEENSNMCSPVAYTRMLDPRYSEDLMFFRQTSRTWDSDVKCSSKKGLKNRNLKKIVW